MDKTQARLELDSQLSALSLVPPWVDALADHYGLTSETRYAINLCLEEALANVVLHGFQNEPGHSVVIETSVDGGSLFFAIEDNAPPFAPVDPGERTGSANLETMQVGGNGIRLIHRFAASVAYEPLPHGNRLTLGFPIPVRKRLTTSTGLESPSQRTR